MSQVGVVDAQNFESEVEQAEQPVVVDFWAEWCPPCQALLPVLDKVAAQFGGQVKILKCDIDRNQEIADRYGVMKIPNLTFFRDGQVLDQTVGFLSEAEVTAKVDELLAAPSTQLNSSESR